MSKIVYFQRAFEGAARKRLGRHWRRAHASLPRSGTILAWLGDGVSDGGHSADVMKEEGGDFAN